MTLRHELLAEPRIYPCANCGKLRTKAEGGATFTRCDACWASSTCIGNGCTSTAMLGSPFCWSHGGDTVKTVPPESPVASALPSPVDERGEAQGPEPLEPRTRYLRLPTSVTMPDMFGEMRRVNLFPGHVADGYLEAIEEQDPDALDPVLPSHFDPNPRPLEPAQNGWLWCEVCQSPQEARGHVCLAPFAQMGVSVREDNKRLRGLVKRVEFPKEVDCCPFCGVKVGELHFECDGFDQTGVVK